MGTPSGKNQKMPQGTLQGISSSIWHNFTYIQEEYVDRVKSYYETDEHFYFYIKNELKDGENGIGYIWGTTKPVYLLRCNKEYEDFVFFKDEQIHIDTFNDDPDNYKVDREKKKMLRELVLKSKARLFTGKIKYNVGVMDKFEEIVEKIKRAKRKEAEAYMQRYTFEHKIDPSTNEKREKEFAKKGRQFYKNTKKAKFWER